MALFGLSSRMTYLRNSLRTPRRTNPSTLLRYSPIHVQRPTAQDFSSRGIHQVPELKYIPFGFEEVEDVELYKPGGLHPAVIGDVLDRGRYRLVHKLGHGVASTIWLARDSLTLDEQDSIGPLVCIKIPKASKGITLSQTSEEMRVTRALHDLATNRGRKDIHSQLLPIHSSFVEIGPNGYHECLVSSAGGPNVKSMYQKSLGRCRSDLARNICRQVAETLHFVHSCGHAHGDLRPANILFRLTDYFMTLTDSEIYAGLDDARVSKLLRIDGLPTDAHAPRGVTPSIHPKIFVPWGFLQEKIAIIGLGSSFKKETIPSALTAVDYRPPEMLLGALTTHIRGQAIDIWSLECLIFEIRTGSCLFEQYFGGPDEVLRDIVLTLGKLPEPWWSSWAKRTQYFDESGAAKKPYQLRNIRGALEEVGNPRQSWFDLFEKPVMQIPQKEIELLDDLLKKMLRYTPEQRITIDDVIRHPWFALK